MFQKWEICGFNAICLKEDGYIMKKSMHKKLFCLFLSALMLLSVFPVSVFAQSSVATVDVSTAKQLENALRKGSQYIRIVSDFKLDRTFYISGQTTIYSDDAHTLTRDVSFGGDIFVIGENSKGESALLNGANAVLTLGNPDSETNNLLVIDGNKNNMTAEVKGTMLFVCNSSKVNVYDNVSFINAQKVGNEKILDEAYGVSYPNRVGGAVAIIASGTINVYGGIFKDNIVNEENTEEGATEEQRNSSQGGAIYNFGNLKIYGGTFSDNQAARGGAVYNYRTVKVYSGVFTGNKATTYGGAIYQSGSQYARIYLGTDGADKGHAVTFANNTSKSNGGAIYAYTQSVIVSYGDVTFRGNNTGSSGGAVAAYGTTNFNKTIFEENTAGSRGGSVYLAHATDELTTRISKITDSVFTNNSAKHGGAVAAYASNETLKNGANVNVINCEFTQNKVTGDGGALYAGRASTLAVDNCTVSNNSAVEGGGLFATEKSKVTVTKTNFTANNAVGEDAYGGAIAVRSAVLNIDEANFNSNSADKNGGAMYIAYVGTSKVDADVNITNSVFDKNLAHKYGGAIYATHYSKAEKVEEVVADNTIFTSNEALKGGALYLTSGSETYLTDVEFNGNTNVNIADAEAEDYNGGAIYVTASVVEIDGAKFENNFAKYNGGAIGVYSEGIAILNNITATSNRVDGEGGFLYNSGSTVNIYNSAFKKNSATKGGGAMSLRSLGVTNIYTSNFEENTAGTHGGAIYGYSGASETVIQDCAFTKNNATKYGGAVYASNGSIINMYNNTATENHANNGGVLYHTTTDTIVTLNGLTVSGNTADKGAIIYGNTNKAILNINKSNYVDSDVTGALDDDYWSNAIVNKLKVNEIADSIPSYEVYVAREKIEKPEFEDETETTSTTTQKKKAVPVTDVFNLGEKSSDADISEEYAALKKLDNSSNFMSRNTTTFDNINKNTVTVDTFVYQAGKKANNVSVGEGLLIYQALLYKKAHPDEEVYIDVSSFRFSIEAAVNINRNSRYFGYMRNLVGQDYDEYGFVRISYLLITAAKMGIHVNVIGQMDGYPISENDPNLEEYFTNQLNDPCDPSYVKNGVIGDYLNFQYCYWTSYGDNDATDMMHTKLCAVSDYIDMNGVEHKNAVWTSSSNLDGIRDNGKNGNSKLQTATIVSDHEAIYRASSNYLRLIAQYCGQEDVYLFRNLVNERTKNQIDLILAGKENKIPKNEQIVYLGGPNDDVFELYFAPFGGDAVVWDETYNPYCKYLRETYDSDDYILFSWNNANYNNNFALGKQMEDILVTAFHKNADARNRIYLNLENFDGSAFDDLVEGQTIGYKSFNKMDFGAIHSKDMQVSYSENGQRYYVSILNSLNIHGGSMYYQTNNLLVIKEKTMDKESVFYTIADTTTKGIANVDFTESEFVGRTFTKNDSFSVGTLSATPYTIEATVQVPKNIEGRAGVIVGNCNGGTEKQLNLEIYTKGRVRLFFNNGSKKVDCLFSKDIRSDSPVNIAVTVNGSTATLYVNGEAVETKTLAATYSGITKKFVIGGDNRTGNSRYFKGKIYSVSLFDDVRTAQEIKNDAIIVPANTSGLVYSTHFEITNQEYSDVSLNGRTFDKTNCYSLGELSETPYTIEATVQVSKNIDGRAGVIVGNYDNTNKKQLNLEVYTKGRVRLFFNNGKKEVECLFSKDIRSASPVNIAVTINGSKATLYVNGKAVETKSLGTTYSGITSNFKIGGDNRKNNTRYFKGTIYSVTLFSDVRTSKEVKKDSIFVTGSEKGLVSSRIFTSQKKGYSSAKFTGRTFGSNTAYSLSTLSSSPQTIEATVKVSKNTSDRAGVIVGNYSNNNDKQLNLEIYTNGRVRLFFNNGSKKVYCLFSQDIRSNKPVHIAVTVNKKTAILYVDGVAVETKKLSDEYKGATDNFKVGGDNRPGNTQYFKGTIYSVSLYSDVRTAKEITRDAIFAPEGTSSLIYSGNYIIKNETYNAVNYTGSKFASDKTSLLETLSATPRTIEATIKLAKSFEGRAGVIVGNNNGADGKQLNLEVHTNGRVRLFFNNGKEKVSCLFSKDIRSSKPVHIAVTVNGKTATLYVDGEAVESNTLSATYDGITQNFTIGGDNRQGNTQYFKGVIYSVSLFSDVRTAKEIKKDAVFVSGDEDSLLYSGYVLNNI